MSKIECKKTPPDQQNPYGQFYRTRVATRLRSIGLDVEYHRGVGNDLYYMDQSGNEVKVLDFVGGFGAGLLGHNHPVIVQTARTLYDSQRPFLAQASMRNTAGLLARRLSERVEKSSAKKYRAILANSGAEAVEAAIKHAALEYRNKVESIRRAMDLLMVELRGSKLGRRASITDSFLEECSRHFGQDKNLGLGELIYLFIKHVTAVSSRPPCFIALRGAFHGKTTGALMLTDSIEYREPWSDIGLRCVHVAFNDEDALSNSIKESEMDYAFPAINELGEFFLCKKSVTNVAGIFIEPIQGEGGIREVSPTFAKTARELCDKFDFPLIFDEIQTGMGRTGTFLASESLGVHGDYYLFSKSLGGGLAKISALLVDQKRMVSEFSYLHTSTFADDDFSSAIAIKTLDVLEKDDCHLIHRCGTIGDYALKQLHILKRKYPDQLCDVRGRGLMIGIEFELTSCKRSPLMEILNEQNLLGPVIAGYFLHEHSIRIAPTLSAPTTLRIEPSALVEEEDIDQFCHAFEELLIILKNEDISKLVASILGINEERTCQQITVEDAPEKTDDSSRVIGNNDTHRRVGFLCHFQDPEDLLRWDTGLQKLGRHGAEVLLERTKNELKPFLVDEKTVVSKLETRVSVDIIGLPFTAQMAISSLRTGEDDWLQDLISKGVELARLRGCSVLGFGGYTSIATRNCLDVAASDMAITSGNSLTAAVAIDATFKLVSKNNEIYKHGNRCLGIVGGAGNIGKIIGEISAGDVDRIILIGRGKSHKRLIRVAAAIYRSAWKAALDDGRIDGIPGELKKSFLFKDDSFCSEFSTLGDDNLYRAISESLGEMAPVCISTDLSKLRQCNIVITASNSAKPIVLPEHLNDEFVVIADIAVPQDVHPDVTRCCPQATVLKGGILRLPLGQDMDIQGMKLDKGEIYACLAEAIILGLGGVMEHFSHGDLSTSQVRRILNLANAHGFIIDPKIQLEQED